MANKIIPRRSLEDSDEGVATTVGTIMALLVFLSLFSMITQQYVPIWMEDNEAYHMEDAMAQFSDLKGRVDNLIINDYKDYPMYSTVRLGSAGVPMLASQTPGTIRVSPEWGNMTLRLDDGDESEEFWGGGNLSLFVPNSYFEEQTIVYEHGAIILEQPQGAVIRAAPHIRIKEIDGNYSMSLTLTAIIPSLSPPYSARGVGVVGVTAELFGATKYTFQNPENVTLRLTTAYPQAWASWFNETTDASANIDGNSLEVNFEGLDISDLRVTKARINIELST
ncbi:MAG: hypothetical protein R6U17_00325 [Thermoplasmata archaeon]